jgi:hypothetical protein
MNLWECEAPGCDSKCVGAGGAIGLRAIGWFFVPLGGLFCPHHRPDKTTDKHPMGICDTDGPCSPCAGDREADKLQYMIAKEVGGDLDFHKRYAERWNTTKAL